MRNNTLIKYIFSFCFYIGGTIVAGYSQSMDVFSAANEYTAQGNYIKPVIIYDSLAGQGALSGYDQQFARTFGAFVLNHDSRLMDKTGNGPGMVSANRNDSLLFGVLTQLSEKCRDMRIVMLNENHWYTEQRYTLHKLLKFFFDNGFRYLAVEAVWEADSLLNSRGYPTVNTGLYCRDPRLANALRTAMELGFEVIGYDSDGTDREYGQARNIFDKTFAVFPEAKVLVYAGGGHIDKSPEKKMMAYHLWDMTGTEPFTIRQRYHSGFDFEENDGLYKTVYSAERSCDLVYKIPEYILDKTPSEVDSFSCVIDLAGCPEDIFLCPHGLYIYRKKEFESQGATAVPVAVYMIDGELQGRELSLPEEEYIILIKDEYGKEIPAGNEKE